MKLQRWSCLFCVVFAITAAPVSALPIYFTDRATFDLATGGGLDFESFEADFATSDTQVFAGFTVTETGGANILAQGRDFPGSVPGALTDGTGFLAYDDNGDSIGTFFDFTVPVNAFGLDIAMTEASTLTIGGSVSDSLVFVPGVSQFWGVIDLAGISTITFDASGGPNLGFDAVSYGMAVVPEPATMTLMGLGLAGFALRRRMMKA